MIENRRGFDLFCHAVLIVGVVLVVFPVYIAFCAATMSEHEVFSVPLSLVPSTHLFENIANVWTHGSGNAATATKLATARTIDGQSFDGSANVTVIAPGTHAATSKATPDFCSMKCSKWIWLSDQPSERAAVRASSIMAEGPQTYMWLPSGRLARMREKSGRPSMPLSVTFTRSP